MHHQRSGADVFYINRYQVVAFPVISISPRCNLRLFQCGVGSVWVCLNTGNRVLLDCKFGSGVEDEGDSGGRLQGSATGSTTSTEADQMKDIRLQGSGTGSTTSTEDDQGGIFVCKDQQQDQLHRQRIQVIFYIVGERKIIHFGTRTYRASSTITSRSYISSF